MEGQQDASGVFPLQGSVKQYDWGKVGRESAVAAIVNNKGTVKICDEERYAELWMGTHPSGPSSIVQGDKTVPLHDFLKDNRAVLGNVLCEKFNDSLASGKLPYLFKVLSVDKALSIQAHPDKQLAAVLHKEKSNHYPDPNHKPEMMIAITPCEALCAFRSVEEIRSLVNEAPEFTELIGREEVNSFLEDSNAGSDENKKKQALKALFTLLMNADASRVAACVETLLARVNKGQLSSSPVAQEVEKLAVRLNSQFPGDVGCFVVYLLNYIKLERGEALFLGPNEPHAYLSGDMMECMAASDNTVRAGLTPKFKDVDTLCSMLTYANGRPAFVEKVKVEGKNGAKQEIYVPPVDDFMVSSVVVPSPSDSFTLNGWDSATICIVEKGKAKVNANELRSEAWSVVERGDIFLVPAGQKLRLENAGSEELFIWTACANCMPSSHSRL